MEALAECSLDDLLEFTSNFDASKGTFVSSSSSSSLHVRNSSCAVRYVAEKSIKASHPPDVIGGGTHEMNEGQPLTDTFTGVIDAVTGELLHGKRSYIFTGETYEGPFSHGGMRHGEGAIVTNLFLPKYSAKESSLPMITSQSRYYGSYRNDRPHHGTLVVSSQGLGFSYHGPFLHSRPHGEEGTLVKSTGYKYHGAFKNGLFHGHGKEKEESKVDAVYEGGFISGMRQGYGIYSIKKTKTSLHQQNACNNDYQDGDSSDRNDCNTEGEELLYLYKGQWVANLKQGEGEEITETIHGKEFFKGQFHMDERHGYGSLIFKNQSRSHAFESEQDLKEPKAEVIVKAEGQWRAGKALNGIHGWTLIYGNGDVYTGFASNFLPRGYGVKRYATRDIYTGQWHNGKRNGEGIFISADGREEYIGEWVDDKIVPFTERNQDETIVRITDCALTLLKQDYREEGSAQNYEGSDNSGECIYRHQRDFLRKIVEQSVSFSLLQFDQDLEKSKEKKAYPKSWPRESSLKPSDTKDHISQDEPDINEIRCEEVTNDDEEEVADETDSQDDHPRTKLITYPNGDTYLGSLCPNTKCRQGYGVYLSVASGSTYSGNFESDMRQGFGILLHPLGKYCGDFKADAKCGMGTLILNDTSSYYGQFENNSFQGRGTLCSKDGTVYVGEWIDGMKNGDGYETLPDGRVYIGDFKDSKRHGIGSLLSEPAGSVLYNGSWLCGVYHGDGLLIKYLDKPPTRNNITILDTENSAGSTSLSSSDMKNNQSDHSNDKRNNLKTQNSSSRSLSCIRMKNNKSCHEVPMIQYKGSFVNGLRHGSGTLINTTNDTEYKGEWHKDIPINGRWRIRMNGSIYSGEANVPLQDGEAGIDNGCTTIDKDNGIEHNMLLSQSFSDVLPKELQIENINFPLPDGFGTMKYQNGDIFEGQFVKGLRHGSGTYVFANNEERCDGIWCNDKMTRKQGRMVNHGNSNEEIDSFIGFQEIHIDEQE